MRSRTSRVRWSACSRSCFSGARLRAVYCKHFSKALRAFQHAPCRALVSTSASQLFVFAYSLSPGDEWAIRSRSVSLQIALVFRNDPHGMDYARDIAEDREQDVDPELFAYTHLQEDPEGWEKYRDDDSQKIHHRPLSVARSL